MKRICLLVIIMLVFGCSQRFTVNDSKEPYLIVNLENGYQMYFNKNVLLKYVTENPHVEKRDSVDIDTLRNMSSSYTMDMKSYGEFVYTKERFWHDFSIAIAFELGAKKMLINKEAILLDKKKRKRLDYYTVDTVYVMRYVNEAFSAFELHTLDGEMISEFMFGTSSDY